MLRLEPIDRNYRSFWIVDDKFSIGSSTKNEMQLSHVNILPIHAVLKRTNEHLYIAAFNEVAKIRINSQSISNLTRIEVGDIITLGTLEFKLVDLSSTRDVTSKQTPQISSDRLTKLDHKKLATTATTESNHTTWKIQSVTPGLKKEIITIDDSKDFKLGRDETNDIIVTGTHVSRRHAEFFMTNGQLIVRDFNSANGTFVNDERIIERAVYIGDEIRFDTAIYNVIEGTIATLHQDINPDQTQFRAAITKHDLRSQNNKDDDTNTSDSTPMTNNTVTQENLSTVHHIESSPQIDIDSLEKKSQQQDVENMTYKSIPLHKYSRDEDDESQTYMMIMKFLMCMIVLVLLAFLVLYSTGQIQLP